jgi:hypothetical protein
MPLRLRPGNSPFVLSITWTLNVYKSDGIGVECNRLTEMKAQRKLFLCLLTFLLAACTGEIVNTGEPFAVSQPTPIMESSTNTSIFLDTDAVLADPTDGHIQRWRAVKINLALLIDETGQTHNVKEFTINLFPDVTYTGVIEQVEQAGDVYSWSGYLKGIEYSYFTMVYTSGAFMGHFASPLGVYEAAFARDDIYRVIQIDQSKFPGGEG